MNFLISIFLHVSSGIVGINMKPFENIVFFKLWLVSHKKKVTSWIFFCLRHQSLFHESRNSRIIDQNRLWYLYGLCWYMVETNICKYQQQRRPEENPLWKVHCNNIDIDMHSVLSNLTLLESSFPQIAYSAVRIQKPYVAIFDILKFVDFYGPNLVSRITEPFRVWGQIHLSKRQPSHEIVWSPVFSSDENKS